MAKRTPAVRARNPFHYPSDDDDDTAEILDEQEKETLITPLTTQKKARNATTHHLVYVLPGLSAIPFLLDLILPFPTQPHRLLPLLGMSSLAATGLLLARLGVTETGFAGMDALPESGSGSGSGAGSSSGSVSSRELALLTGMLQRVKMGPQAPGFNSLLLGALPGVVFAVIVGAKVAMAGIDPERELSRYKYGYKGA
ncbi:predicted protein [Chaetomium globosum CBS 148.51]|uniref:Uncharacterized protein n=1 Tax=Chaetomium globosum (strain ATCC 6205 / CBS 148.51 / DSM 1962 / NBRC 6347 / NRRL 1970) TaxID=306901 RepID=Q2GVS5_CHAGB|nr:uncharacterized protein CHGG_07929 [Chaetomium globosum CBS 148.51]EAQ86676.1 predicted protein [Chaetomium globosum CBS 148.51]